MKNQTKEILFTKAGKANKAVINALRNCRFNSKTNQIYTGYYNGSGKWAIKASAMHTVTSVLEAQGYKFTTGNDAPKGGITGDFVKMSAVAFNFIAKFYQENK